MESQKSEHTVADIKREGQLDIGELKLSTASTGIPSLLYVLYRNMKFVLFDFHS